MNNSRKWLVTMSVSLSQTMAYKLDFVLFILAPPLVFFLIKYNLWVSLYRLTGSSSIQGYTLIGMVEYQAYALIVSMFAQSYSAMRLSEDIRYGRISAFLLYPFGFWEYNAAGFLAAQLLQLVISSILICGMWFLGWLSQLSFLTLFCGFFFAGLAGFFWFTVIFTLGLLAFWLEESWILRVIFSIITSFLSGGVVPLELFPKPMLRVLEYLPFPYLTFVPVKIFTGTYDGSLVQAFSILMLWLVIAIALCGYTWRRGVRLYSAAGI
jgi:ABC-2 type transport system permease protein